MTVTPLDRVSFNSGEIGRELLWRHDTQKHGAACRVLENFLVTKWGSALRRPGTQACDRLGNAGLSNFRLIPFQFNRDTSYVVLFSPNGAAARLTVYDSNGEKAFILNDSGYEADEVRQLRFWQSLDVLFIAHPNHPLKRLERLSTTPEANLSSPTTPTWRLVSQSFRGGPYQTQNTDTGANLVFRGETWTTDAEWSTGDEVIYESGYFLSGDLGSAANVSLALTTVGGEDVTRYSVVSFINGTEIARRYHAYRVKMDVTPEEFARIDVGGVVRCINDNIFLPELDGYRVVVAKENVGIFYYVYLAQDDYYRQYTDGILSGDNSIEFVTFQFTGSVQILRPVTSGVVIYRALDSVASGGSAPPSDPTNWERIEGRGFQGNVYAYTEDNTDVFDPLLVGALFRIRDEGNASFSGKFRKHGGDIQFKGEFIEDGTASTENYADGDTSPTIPVFGTITFRTAGVSSGDWRGKLVLETSEDGGTTWATLATIQNEGAAPVRELTRVVDRTGTIARVRCVDISPADEPAEFYVEVGGPIFAHFTIEEEMLAEGYLGRLLPEYPLRRIESTWQWAIGAFNDRDGYPVCGCIHEERLILASTGAQANTIWGSTTNDFEEWGEGTLATSPFAFSLASDTYSAVEWVVSRQDLLIGTTSNEWSLGSRSAAEGLTAANVSARRQTEYGSASIQAVASSGLVAYVERGQKRIRGASYSFDSDSYQSMDLTAFHGQIAGVGGFLEIAFARDPLEMLVCLRSDGQLATFTLDMEQGVSAWGRHTFGDGVESMCVLRGDNADLIWLVVDRGDAGFYLERLDLAGDVYLDWWHEATSLTGVVALDLEGPTPDGFVVESVGAELVEGTEWSIDSSVTSSTSGYGLTILDTTNRKEVVCGVRFTSDLWTTPLILRSGSAQGHRVRATGVDLYLIETFGGELSVDGGASYQDIPLLTDAALEGGYDPGDGELANAPVMFTGKRRVPIKTGSREEMDIRVRTEANARFEIAAFGVDKESN